MQGSAHGDALDHRLPQGSPGSGDGLLPAGTGDDDLGEHRIEQGGDDVALSDSGLDADTGTGRPAQAGDGTGGGGQTSGGILTGDAQLEAVTAGLVDLSEVTALGDAQLDFDQIGAGDLLGDAVLHLQTGVDLQEPDIALGGQEELAGGHPDVVDRLQEATGGLDQTPVDALGQEGRGSLLEELLVASLQGAVAGGDHGETAVAVAGALGLDVTCGRDEPLQDEGSAALRRGLEGRGGPDLVVVVQDGDAASAATVGALQGDRVAVGGGEGDDGLGVGDRVGDARHRGDLGPLGGGSGAHLVSEGVHGLG